MNNKSNGKSRLTAKTPRHEEKSEGSVTLHPIMDAQQRVPTFELMDGHHLRPAANNLTGFT